MSESGTCVPVEGVPIRIAVAGREVDGVVDDVRWTPTYNTRLPESMAVAVDIGTATIVASLDQITLL